MHILTLTLLSFVVVSCGQKTTVDTKLNQVNDYACILLRSGDGDPPDIFLIHEVVATKLKDISKGKNYTPFSGKAYLLNGNTIVDYALVIKREANESDFLVANKVMNDLNANYGDGKTWRPTQLVMKYDAKGIEVRDEFMVLFQTIWK